MKAAVEHLINMIRIPSVSSLPNRPIIDYAEAILNEARWKATRLIYQDARGVEKINLIAAPLGQNPDDPKVDLAFLCHTDTVPYASHWAGALDPAIADDLVSGCGACDVKGFLACLLTAIATSDPLRFIDGLRLVLTADEEVGCIGASQLLSKGLLRPTRAVIGEPTSLHPARAGKGYCLAEITIIGREAHSAHPEQGRSAIFAAARLISRIEQYAERLAEVRNELFSPAYTTLNVGTVQGGTAKNVVPGQCTFQVEWRPLPGPSATDVLETIKGFANQLATADLAVRCKVDILRQQAGFETPANSALVRSIEKVTGRAATSIPFGSEASLLASVAEEVIVFGPGDMRTAHSNRECVPIEDLEEAVAVLSSLMCKS